MHIACLCMLLVTSACARVATNNENISDIITNLIDDTKSNDTVLDENENHVENKEESKHIDNMRHINITNEVLDDNDTLVVIEFIHKIRENDTEFNIIEDNMIDNVDTNNKTFVMNNGTALLLTPLIEEGRYEEARNACRVNSDLFFGIESYSGFFTVNKTYNSNLFFWYFPIEGKTVNETPWIIWLQGGPGASSLTGLFDEIGPFHVDKEFNLIKNPHTWHTNHSLLFIDNPIGTGYSFTDNELGYVTDKDTYSNHLYSLVEQLLQIFPELQTAPLYVAGESYAGKYVPSLAMELHKHKTSAGLKVNLQGLIVGNGYIEPSMIASLPRAFYNFGLIDRGQLEMLKPLHDSFTYAIDNDMSRVAKEKWGTLIMVLLMMSHQKHAYNFLKDDFAMGNYLRFLQRSDVKRAIHVGDIKCNFINITTNMKLESDFLSTTKPLYESLLNEYRVLSYCGQLDQMLSCASSSESYRLWKWNGSEEFLNATRFPFMLNKKLAGYHKSGGGFTEVVIRGAGHMVPLDMPIPAQTLVTSWVYQKPLSKNAILKTSFLHDYIKKNSALYLI